MLIVNNVRDLTGNLLSNPRFKNFKGTGPEDHTPPEVLFAELISSNTALVQFSERVEKSSAENTGNYTITDNYFNPVEIFSATRQADQSQVLLTITGMFSKSMYYLTVSTEVVDLSLNPLVGPPHYTVSFFGEGTHVIDVKATANTRVRVLFSSGVELSAAQTVSNYSIPGLSVFSAVRDSTDYSIVDLITSHQEDINYTLTVTGVIEESSEDFSGDVAPYIQNVSSWNNTQIIVYFSEAVEEVTAQKPSNYSIPGLTVSSAVRDPNDHARVNLTTSKQSGISYTITISNVTDLTSNLLDDPASFVFTRTGTTDSTKPKVLSALLIDSDTVEVQFSEPVDKNSSENTANYSIKDNLGVPVTITSAARQLDIARVWLNISGNFSQCLYILTVSTDVMDLRGNKISGYPENIVSFSGEDTIPESFDEGAVLVDPMGEISNNFSLFTKYRGRVYIGPAKSNNAVFRLKPDGTSPELVTLRFTAGGKSTSSLDPGPDGEDGIDYITGGLIGEEEYLFIGPSKSNGYLNYIYFTSENGHTQNFRAINLDNLLGFGTVGVSSMVVFNDNLYVGFPDNLMHKPYFHRIINILENPVPNEDVINLDVYKMPRIGSYGNPANKAGIVGIDSFGIYNNRLYLANGGNNKQNEDGGIIRSTTSAPLAYTTNPAHWEDVTVTGSGNPEWYNYPDNNRFSIELSKKNKIIPAEKAFPAMVVFNSKLYAIRNTVGSPDGPQLWKYDGFIWSLVADNGEGLTDMGNSKNDFFSLLVVNGDRLYIGYDNSEDGIEMFRTKEGVTEPQSASDFEQVANSGLGDSSNNQRIYHGFSISYRDNYYLWLLSGKSGGSLRVYRTTNQ
ncbi:MAG: Ig-like domain-containing protein [Spirochaetota bacterium]